MSDPIKLTIQRGKHALRVVPRPDGGFDCIVNGGGAVTQVEYDQIAAFVGETDGAQRLLAKLRARL